MRLIFYRAKFGQYYENFIHAFGFSGSLFLYSKLQNIELNATYFIIYFMNKFLSLR